jgi:hypothetical protein
MYMRMENFGIKSKSKKSFKKSNIHVIITIESMTIDWGALVLSFTQISTIPYQVSLKKQLVHGETNVYSKMCLPCVTYGRC